MIYSIFSWEDFVPEEDFVLCIFSPLLLTFSCGNDCILEDFVLGGFCPGRILSSTYLCSSLVSLIIYGILEYVFFPKEDFVPEKDFVLSIHFPLLLMFSCCNDCILLNRLLFYKLLSFFLQSQEYIIRICRVEIKKLEVFFKRLFGKL